MAAPESVQAFHGEVDEVVAVLQPADLRAIGLWYADSGKWRTEKWRQCSMSELRLQERHISLQVERGEQVSGDLVADWFERYLGAAEGTPIRRSRRGP